LILWLAACVLPGQLEGWSHPSPECSGRSQGATSTGTSPAAVLTACPGFQIRPTQRDHRLTNCR
jgi:hypothetical protein